MGETEKITLAAFCGFIFGLGSTVAAMALPQAYPHFPLWGWQLLFWGGIAGMTLSALIAGYELLLQGAI